MIFGHLRQSPEDPTSNLADPATWMWEAFGSGTSHAGVSVNERTALNYSAFWACVRYLANAIAMPPLKVYRRDGDRREPDRMHRNWTLLHDRPNPMMSSFQFRQVAQSHLMTWGNFYAEREVNGRNETVALWPLRPDRVRIVIQSNEKFLAYEMKDGGLETLAPGRYLHVAGLGYDGVMGYSPVAMIRQSIGLGMAAEEYGARFYGAGGRVPYIVTTPESFTPERRERFRKAWETAQGGAGDGLKRSHRVAILDEGMQVHTIGMPHDDSQFLETRRFQVEEMARVNGVPQHKIQSLEKADFSNIEQQAIEAVQDAVMPWAINWEQQLNWELFKEGERASWYCEFELDVLLRGDAKSRAETLKIKREWGIINADEWRQLDNQNPLPDGLGQKYLVPLNMVDAANMEALSQSQDEPPDDRFVRRANETRADRSAASRHRLAAAYVKVFERAAQHFAAREARAALRILRKAFKGERPAQQLLEDLREFYQTFPEAIRRELLPVVLALAELVRQEIALETGQAVPRENLERFAVEYVSGYSDRHIGSSMRQVRKLLEDTPSEEVQEVLAVRFGEWESSRAAKIAANEAVRAGNALSVTAYAVVGVAALVWRAIGANCPLCTKLNGRRVGIAEPFLTSGDVVESDDEKTQPLRVKSTVRHPPLHRGCDCVITGA